MNDLVDITSSSDKQPRSRHMHEGYMHANLHPKEISIKTTAKDDTVLDEYFATSGNKIYIGRVTQQKLTELERMHVRHRVSDLIEEFKVADIEAYKNERWPNYHKHKALYTMHKLCLIGSDMYFRGQVAPLQMQPSWNRDTGLAWLAHPGSDRSICLRSLIGSPGTKKNASNSILIQFEVAPWMKDLDPELVNGFELIESKEQLKKYYKNWDDSQFYNVEYSGGIDMSQFGFMNKFMRNVNKHIKGIELGRIPSPSYHMEIKALHFRLGLRDTMDKFLECCDLERKIFGPWFVDQDLQALIFDSELAWYFGKHRPLSVIVGDPELNKQLEAQAIDVKSD